MVERWIDNERALIKRKQCRLQIQKQKEEEEEKEEKKNKESKHSRTGCEYSSQSERQEMRNTYLFLILKHGNPKHQIQGIRLWLVSTVASDAMKRKL
jgi:hypothetical protein